MRARYTGCMRYRRVRGYRLFFIHFSMVSFLSAPLFAFAAHSCEVSPFSKSIAQGESVSFAVHRNTAVPSAPFAMTLGDFPNGVTGGFVSAGSASSSSRFTLVFTASASSQTGNFGVSILSSEESSEGLHASACQLNLIVSERNPNALYSPSQDALPNSPGTSAALSPAVGPLSALPAAQFSETEEETASPLPPHLRHIFTVRLSRGDSGPEVFSLQRVLKWLAFFPQEIPETGYFGSITKEAVERFQKIIGLDVVGIVGPKTRKALNVLTSSNNENRF